MERQQRIIAMIGGTLVLIGGGAFVAFRSSPRADSAPTPASVVVVPPEPEQPVVRSWMDGHVLAMGEGQPAAVAVVIDNAPEARPQSGVADASVVFEVPVEGGRTRFVTVFPIPTPSNGEAKTYDGEIGPVRSARPYLIGLAEMIGAPLVHVGGSNTALRLLRGRNHVDQYYDPPFRRVTFRSAPFNVYTSIAQLAEFMVARGWTTAARAPEDIVLWPYADAPETEIGESAERIRLPFGTTTVEWKYDVASERYLRWVDGQPHRDANGKPVTVMNVVVLRIDAMVLDRVGRLSIPALENILVPLGVATRERDGIGSARAAVFTAGRRQDVGWGNGRPETGSPTGLFGLHAPVYDRSPSTVYNAVPLRPGTTWVEFVNFDLDAAR